MTFPFEISNPGIGFAAGSGLTQAEIDVVQDIAAFGTAGQVLATNAGANGVEWITVSGSGDVSKVGTPLNNQIGVWTGNGTLEGDVALTFDTTTDTLSTTLITATTVTANLTGNVTGNVSGSALTVTQAAQTAITSLGTLTALVVDNISVDLNTISTSSGNLNITPVAGSNITLDGTVTIDAGVVAGMTSLTMGGNVIMGTNSITMTGSIAATGARVTKGWFTDLESTNMPTVGGTGILTSLTAPQFTTIELGHATDTTLSRVSAGLVAVEGVNLVNVSTAQVLTNKDLTATSNTFTAASTTQSGVAEASIASEINTGTDAARYVSPDSLAGSNFGIRYVQTVLNGTTALTTAEKVYFRIPAGLTGMNLVSVTGTVGTGAAGSSSSGTPTFTVKNVTDNNQMLSTSLTIDVSEYTSATAAVAVAINASFDDVVTDDLIEVAVTTSGTGVTYATICLGFQLP